MTDAKGNYLLGIENAIAPDNVLMAMKLPISKNKYNVNDRDNYIKAQVCVNGFIKKTMRITNFAAGAISRNPTFYYLTNKKKEAEKMVGRSSKYMYQRVALFSERGNDVFKPKEKKILKETLSAMQQQYKKEKLTKKVRKIERYKLKYPA